MILVISLDATCANCSNVGIFMALEMDAPAPPATTVKLSTRCATCGNVIKYGEQQAEVED